MTFDMGSLYDDEVVLPGQVVVTVGPFALDATEVTTAAWGDAPPAPSLLNGCGAECSSAMRDAGVPLFGLSFNGRDAYEGTAPVGSYPKGASAFGVLDLAGNVAEWVDGSYAPYNKALRPASDGGALDRVARGGSFGPDNGSATALEYRTIRRQHHPQGSRDSRIGFRCAMDLDPASLSVAAPKELPPPPKPYSPALERPGFR